MTSPEPLPQPLRVLCVDDNDLLASSMERFVQRDPTLAWLGWVGNAEEVLPRAAELRPHVVLMDIDMPGVDTFSLVEQLGALDARIRVVMFSGHVHSSYLDRALDSGAWGYLSKDEEPAALLEGIRRVARGELALSKEVIAVQRARER